MKTLVDLWQILGHLTQRKCLDSPPFIVISVRKNKKKAVKKVGAQKYWMSKGYLLENLKA